MAPRVAAHPVDAAFDPLAPDYLADPYPTFARLRRDTPVCYAPSLDMWVVSRYDDIMAVVHDPATFSSAKVQVPIQPLAPEAAACLRAGVRVTPTTSNADPPQHRRTRGHAARAFSARRVAALEPRVLALAEGLVDRFAADGRADLVRAFAFPLPALTIFTMLGFPEEDTERLKGWCGGRLRLQWGRPPAEEQLPMVEAMAALWGYIEAYVARRATDLRDDYTSDLLRIRAADEAALSLQEIGSILYSLTFAGHETTTSLLGNCLRQLLTRPGLWEAARADPALREGAVEETLRFDTSVPTWRRTTTRPVEIAGVAIPAGATLLLLLGSANHDERHFAEPERFDLRRPDARDHLAFSQGIHYCLGAALARLEARIALEVLGRRLPGLRLDPPDQAFTFDPNISFRGPQALWATWDVDGAAPRAG